VSVKVNRIELDKTNGLTIQVVNGVKRQTIFLDGDKITITVRGPTGTSIIEQTPTTVTVSADNFIVNAKTITQNAVVEASISAGATPLPPRPVKPGDPPEPVRMTPGPSRVTLIPASVVTMAPEIALLGEANVNLTAPTITSEAEAAFNVVSPLLVSLEGGNVNVTALTGVEIEAPNIALIGAIEFL